MLPHLSLRLSPNPMPTLWGKCCYCPPLQMKKLRHRGGVLKVTWSLLGAQVSCLGGPAPCTPGAALPVAEQGPLLEPSAVCSPQAITSFSAELTPSSALTRRGGHAELTLCRPCLLLSQFPRLWHWDRNACNAAGLGVVSRERGGSRRAPLGLSILPNQITLAAQIFQTCLAVSLDRLVTICCPVPQSDSARE